LLVVNCYFNYHFMLISKISGCIIRSTRFYLTLAMKEGNMAENEIGVVSDFFAHVVVAGIDITGTLKVGDKIHIKGHTTDIEMDITSMQIDNKNVAEAKKGQSVGIKVPDKVRAGDKVFIVD
jgi:translation initiation factor IF-2